MGIDPARLSEAIVVWTGWGEASWPDPGEQRLVARFGESDALDLLPVVKAIEDEFFSSDARHHAADPAEMARQAIEDFRIKHPELSNEAMTALAWCYTFTYR